MNETHMKRLLLLTNPGSRHGAEKFDEALQSLQQLGYQVTNSPEELKNNSFSELLKKYHQEIDFVIVGGGDGSVNIALPDLVKYQIPLHVLPLGTANNLSRTLNLPSDLKENINSIKKTKIKNIDLGKVNDIYFVNVAGIGLSTKINKYVTSESKKRWGVLAFVLTAFQKLHLIKPFRVKILAEGQKLHRSLCWQLSICNGRHYGSGLIASEKASLEDGLLDCISSEMGRWWHALFHLSRFFSGRFHGTKDITLIRSSRIELQTSRKKDIDVDGDIKTTTPALFTVEKEVLKVFFIPEEVAPNDTKSST